MFSGILFTVNLRSLHIQVWKVSNDARVEKVTLFQN